MVGELITLPLRIGARVTHLSLSTAEEALRLAANVAEQVIRTARPESPAMRPPTTHSRPEPSATSVTEARGAAPERPPASTPPAPEPAHVSTQPTLVEELAEPGAEDGAGAELHVDEPWAEYERMGAKDIVARVQEATPAELAAVELYERTHRARQTVLTAAERRLRAASGRGRKT